MDEGQYIAAIDQVKALMPLEEAKRQLAEAGSATGGISAPTLHPYPGRRLEHNPIPLLLALNAPAFNVWTELLRLGLALLRTRDLLRITSKRKLLLNLDQYLSTLFEVEALAEFVVAELRPAIMNGTPDCVLHVGSRRVNVEMRLGEARFGVALFHAIHPPFHDKFGKYQIHIPSGVGGQGERVHSIARAINADLQQLFERRVRASMSCATHTIDYLPTSAPEVSVTFGPKSQTFVEMLDAQVRAWLREKDDKLMRIGERPSVVALDVRGLVWGLPSAGGRVAIEDSDQRQTAVRGTREQREAIIHSIQTFLTGARAVVGVLAWWRKFEWELTLHEQVFQPWEITFTTRRIHEMVPSGRTLQILFEQLELT